MVILTPPGWVFLNSSPMNHMDTCSDLFNKTGGRGRNKATCHLHTSADQQLLGCEKDFIDSSPPHTHTHNRKIQSSINREKEKGISETYFSPGGGP